MNTTVEPSVTKFDRAYGEYHAAVTAMYDVQPIFYRASDVFRINPSDENFTELTKAGIALRDANRAVLLASAELAKLEAENKDNPKKVSCITF